MLNTVCLFVCLFFALRTISIKFETNSMSTCVSVFVKCRVLTLSDIYRLSVTDASSECMWAVRRTDRVNMMNKPRVNGTQQLSYKIMILYLCVILLK